MVLKQKKYSVPSGTTFRTGSHSYRTKYLKQATVVKTLRNAEADDVCPDGEFHPGVEYSLNKKGRWNLPRQIREEFHDSDENVSLQQFHKLKRRAKCISYEANNGPVRKVVPKKYYFDGKSVEQSLMKEASESGVEGTQVGQSEDTKKPVEVTYSIYLPAGSKSAITYNPKYINVPVYANADDEHIHTAISKKGRVSKPRLRINPSSYEDDDWSTTDESECDLPYSDWPSDAGLSASYEDYDRNVEGACASDWGLEDGFGGYIELALQKKELEKYEIINHDVKIRPTKEVDLKERKIYMEPWEQPEQPVKANPEASLPSLPDSITITLPNSATSESHLMESQAVSYAEAETVPRRFVIDVSERVEKVANDNVTAYLALENVGSGTGGTTFRVWLQSSEPVRLPEPQSDMTSLDDVISFVANAHRTKTDQLVLKKKRKAAKQKDHEQKRESQFNSSTNQLITHPVTFSNLKHACGWTVHTQHPATIATPTWPTHDVEPSATADNSLPSHCCNICLSEDDDQSTTLTCMRSCGHVFCEQCWVCYATSALKSGVGKLACPSYECSAELSDGFIQSLVTPGIYQNYLTIKKFNYLATNKWSWCPNTQCGRLVKTEVKGTNGRYMNVDCECRLSMCNDCKELSHWPATCEQTQSYRQMLHKRGDDGDRFLSTPSVLVKFMQCPNCYRGVEKSAGCNYIYCVCEHAFCWACGKAWNGGNDFSHYECFLMAPRKEAELTYVPPPNPFEDVRDVPALYVQAVGHHHSLSRACRVKAGKFFTDTTNRAMNSVRKTSSSAKNKLGTSSKIIKEAKASYMGTEYSALEVLNELHHCAEYTGVTLLFRKPKSLPYQKEIEQCLDKIHFVTLRFHQLLETDERPATEVMEHLRNYTKIGRQCIVSLVSALKLNGLA